MAEQKDTDKILDELVRGKEPEEILGKEGVLKHLTKRLVERALEGEMTTHLGYEKHAREGRTPATLETVRRRRKSRGISAKSRSRFPVTETDSSNRSS